jgi:predicted GNAT family N-acyltransferase
MPSTNILKTSWQIHRAALSSIRTQVFVDEQHVPIADEWDGLDDTATHFLVMDKNNQPLGCARLLIEEKSGSMQFHIGRVAIIKPSRGQGLGIALMHFIIDYCQELAPGNRIYLHAQCERQGFYKALGFSTEGDIFMDAGIPHISMFYRN